MDMDNIIMKVSQLTGVTSKDIQSRKKTGDICEARKIFIYISWRRFGISQKSIAGFINRTPQGISSLILDFDQQLRIYRGLKNKVNYIEKQIFTADDNQGV